jgi:hypothetical protein
MSGILLFDFSGESSIDLHQILAIQCLTQKQFENVQKINDVKVMTFLIKNLTLN